MRLLSNKSLLSQLAIKVSDEENFPENSIQSTSRFDLNIYIVIIGIIL